MYYACIYIVHVHVHVHVRTHKKISGQVLPYYVHCLQAVIGSVGGVELLYPILEQVYLPIRKRVEPNIANGDQEKLGKANKTEGVKQDNLSPSPIKESPTNMLDVAWWFDGKYQFINSGFHSTANILYI